MEKKTLHILAFSIFGLFILANIIFFSSDICFACEQNLVEGNLIEIKTINLNEWKGKVSNKDSIILDIRTPKEFNVKNIETSINIDFYNSNFKEELAKLDRNKTYLIYCRSGNRGNQALPIFEELEFKEVYNLKGGINVWN